MTHELSSSPMPNPEAALPSAPSVIRHEAMRGSDEKQLDCSLTMKRKRSMQNKMSISDYQDVLQDAARMYLERHHSQHLGNDQALFSRTVAHLIDSFGCSQATAENLTRPRLWRPEILRRQPLYGCQH